MTTEENQLVVNETEAVEKGADIANPDVVHRQFFREWKGFFQHRPPECHATAQVAIVAQEVEKLPLTFAHHPIERGGGDVESLVGDVAVATDTFAVLQGGTHGRHLSLAPFIVLVGKENDVALGTAQGILKIIDGRMDARSLHYDASHRRDVGDQFAGFLQIAILGNDNLVRRRKLGKNGCQLGAQHLTAVICGYANRNHLTFIIRAFSIYHESKNWKETT